MTYRMDSAKPAIMKFGYAINYDKEIAEDERQISYLTSDFAVRLAAWAEDRCVREIDPVVTMDGQRWAAFCDIADAFVAVPEIFRDTLDLTNDDLRALWVYLSSGSDPNKIAKDPFGAEQPGDYARGARLSEARVFFPWPGNTFGEWRSMRETGPRGRAALLKKAKADRARHLRNKAKFGR